jgi:uncharacterized protein (DUF2252 family)
MTPIVPRPRADMRPQTPAERAARGKAARAAVPRSSHTVWDPPAARSDPVDVLIENAEGRLSELVPVRYGRMLASPFAFFRGGAAVMAADLAPTPSSGVKVQLCGDAHLSNFGGYASAERDMVFDLNDFDETLPGPWEWDVKRLVASLAVAGREMGYTTAQRRQNLTATAAAYRTAMRRFAEMGNLQVWYSRLTAAGIVDRWGDQAGRTVVRNFERNVQKAMTKDSVRAAAKLTKIVDGEHRIVSSPPLVVPLGELLSADERASFEDGVKRSISDYRRSLAGDRRHLLERFRYVDMARKVVGVGSVGTRAWIILLAGRDGADPLVLQLKEARPSVLAPFAGKSRFTNQGQRVVEGQRLMQASSDIFLGWSRGPAVDGTTRDFYVRQLWDWKISADVGQGTPATQGIYGQMCGWTLARAHARSGDRIAIAAYLGSGAAFDNAVAEFAEAYADQNERDYQQLVDAVKAGHVEAELGV